MDAEDQPEIEGSQIDEWPAGPSRTVLAWCEVVMKLAAEEEEG